MIRFSVILKVCVVYLRRLKLNTVVVHRYEAFLCRMGIDYDFPCCLLLM